MWQWQCIWLVLTTILIFAGASTRVHRQSFQDTWNKLASKYHDPTAAAQSYVTRYISDIKIVSFDNKTILAGDAFVPEPRNSTEKFPVIVMINSWCAPQWEYLLKAMAFAQKGYVVLEYTARGWYSSGGEIDDAGPSDQRDATAVLDFIFDHQKAWNVKIDESKVAFVGISYGAGISLEAAGIDPRITTVVSMSGWHNLTTALFPRRTPSAVWGELLVLTSHFFGRIPASFVELMNATIHFQNLTAGLKFGDDRAASQHLAALNKRKIPIFMSNNYFDRFFFPDDQLWFWTQLEGPKMMLLNYAIHAGAEVSGLLDLSNFVWNEAERWLDYHLKGIPNGINKEPQVRMQVGPSKKYENFAGWPDPKVSMRRFYMSPRDEHTFGSLGAQKPALPRQSAATSRTEKISFSLFPGLGDGIPVASDVFRQVFAWPIHKELLLLPREHSLLWLSPELSEDTRFCGTATLDLTFIPNSQNWQVFAFLYHVDVFDIGMLISDTFDTHLSWDPRTGTPEPPRKPGSKAHIHVPFHTLCEDIPSGHRIAVGIALYNVLYSPINSSSSFAITVQYEADSYIEIPIVPH